jgi:Ion transport protein
LAASDAKENDTPMDCFEPKCYSRYAICCRCVTNEDSAFAKKWARLRYICNKISINNNFEMFIIVMIVLSSIALALEDKFIHEKVVLKQILEYGDKIFTIIFTAEMLLKWVGFGFRKYFSDGWCWLDFIIVSVSIPCLNDIY